MSYPKIVIKIGGSVLFPENIDDGYFSEKVRELKSGLSRLYEAAPNARIALIIGGGFWAKSYIRFAEKLGVDGVRRDTYGIEISRLNADLTRYLLSDIPQIKVAPITPRTPLEATNLLDNYNLVVMGGTYPGQSTIGTSVLVAEALRADLLIIITDVKGVYREDPKVDPNAERFKKIKIEELKDLVVGFETKPGTYKLMDLVAVKLLERAKIPTIIAGCENLECIGYLFKSYRDGEIDKIFEYGTLLIYE